MDAKELDQGRGGDYWTSAHEMAARAFQGYVEDKMAEQAGRNPFLNYAPANFMMLTPWGGKRVFPHGEERKAINAAFDKFVAILETKETDKGTALFSKSTTPVVNPHSETSLNQAVTKAMDTLFGQGWTNRLMATGKFKMISRDEAVQIAGNQAANAKGFYNSDNDTTYLVHDNIEKDTSSKALVGLMLHEISTHSLNLGKSSEAFQDILRRFEALKATNPKVQAAFANVPASAPEEHKVEEALAEYLQANPKSSLAQRIVEWFRQAVRALGKTLPVLERAKFSQWANKLTEAELIGMATSALKSAPDSLQFDNVGRNREGIKLSGDNKKLLAPNGKPSNLNAMQHAQVRTEAFKKWFGDWETVANLKWLDTGSPVASMEGDEIPTLKGIAKLADWIAQNWIDRKETVIIRSDLGEINIDRKSVKDSAAHGLSKTKVQGYYLVPDVIREGKILGTLPHQTGKPDAIIIAAPVKIGASNYKMYVEVRHDANMQRMYVHEVVLNAPTTAFKTAAEVPVGSKLHSANRGAIFSFLQNLRNVKASKVVDENGEPLVVYHGTNKNFDTFEPSSSGMIFFTDNKDSAMSFGYPNYPDPIAVYLKIHKLASDENVIKIAEKISTRNLDDSEPIRTVEENKKLLDVIRKKGFDGLKMSDSAMDAGKFQSYIALNPNQIKSATENNGDFSQSNNIKFSRSTPSNTPADNSAMRSFFAPAKGKQALGWLAGFFQRNHLIDFVAKDLPELPNNC